MSELCILTPHPRYEEDWGPSAESYRALLGNRISFRPWTDPGDLSGFRMVSPLLAWGYQRDPDSWFASLDHWEASALPVANPVSMLRWNTDKAYLLDLEARDVAIVPTMLSDALDADALVRARSVFGAEELVVKPSVSGGADGTYRLGVNDPVPLDVRKRKMLIQPLMSTVSSIGEYSLFFFDGVFSHAIVKRPATGDFRVQEQFGGREEAIPAPEGAMALAASSLSAMPSVPLYARVDMVTDGSGGFLLMELELIEPALFLAHAADGGELFADSILRRLRTI